MNIGDTAAKSKLITAQDIEAFSKIAVTHETFVDGYAIMLSYNT